MSRLHFDDDDEVATQRTYGTRLDREQIYSLEHPKYKHFSQVLSQEVDNLARQENARQAAAKPVLLPFTLSANELADLSTTYSEFNIVAVPINRPVHTQWVASQYLANEYLTHFADRYSDSIVHLGGSQLSALMSTPSQIHVEYDESCVISAHNHYAGLVDIYRIFRDQITMAETFHVTVPRGEYERMLRGEAHRACRDSECVHTADVFCADLSLHFMSPVQFASAMVQHGSKGGFGFFIYHPVMLVKNEGVIPGTDVYFKRKGNVIEFLYPDGNVGVSICPNVEWGAWLTSHCFRIPGTDAWFRLELMHARGPFMFFRMARVHALAAKVEYRHALELPYTDDTVLVKSWKLKDGFAATSDDSSAWEPHHFMVAARTERRVREFAMQCKPENFTRAAIKKQIRTINNRWVLSGTTVTVMPPLEPDEVEQLTTAIFARAFVDRYESGKLSSELMTALSRVKAFTSLSFSDRVLALSRSVLIYTYSYSVGALAECLRKVLDGVASFFLRRKGSKAITICHAPVYVVLRSYAGGFYSSLRTTGEVINAAEGCHIASVPRWTLPGAVIMAGARKVPYPTTDNLNDPGLLSVTTCVTDLVDVSDKFQSKEAEAFKNAVVANNETDAPLSDRWLMPLVTPVGGVEITQEFKMLDTPDCVETLNQMYREMLPAVAYSDFTGDTYSLSLDPQDRTLNAIYLRMPRYFGDAPKPKLVYRSNLVALNVPKRQNTGQELLTAVASRNLSAPALAEPQDTMLVEDVWDSFLDDWCVPDARVRLENFRKDPMALSETALKDWVGKAKPGVAERITAELNEIAEPLANMRVGDYLAMLKSDVKPTLSEKPVGNVVAPQVIVYHDKLMSALFSSIYRGMVQRFLSIIRPEILVNLRKNPDELSRHVSVYHPFGKSCSFLENDFSQYDKSQAEFAFELEEHVFRQLGMNEEYLQQWEIGHHYSNIRCVSTGLSLHTMYQRKSGDATTAFGNVILNVLTVHYAYRGTQVDWALFMGDDSLVCTSKPVVGNDTAVRVLSERFNLIAKYYITDAPYFASNFVLIDEAALSARLIPDPVKRIERLSMDISGEEPMWEERWQSCKDTLKGYQEPETAHHLSKVVPLRYHVQEGFVRGAAGALGTICRDKKKFRALWKTDTEVLLG